MNLQAIFILIAETWQGLNIESRIIMQGVPADEPTKNLQAAMESESNVMLSSSVLAESLHAIFTQPSHGKD